ncbi:hypothetical protein PV416_40035 [Streptomyces ipomoeae]|nr:hypothetical protein [Streptomyces ipomoeae]MDX2698032.1 hypothetical protein [Streptomyces ipomoeae]MDX2827090.1 hypothetical protein [Streptomyces ipomoeae]MDX2843027.1 hypothetical protein [Streptomyces ipomoeae]MDX2879698.1 hypothetical protein [Streptomyces ipomoeae]TQE34400.1 hypothetical protein Sipo7851_17795 [Streptomyces ipomoeae]
MRTFATATRAGVLAATAGALLFTGVAAQGTAIAAPQAQPAKLTVAKYRGWLKNNDDAAASIKLLKAFDKLPKAKQQKFVDYLQNRKVQTAFDTKLSGYTNKGGHRPVAYNKDIRFVGDVKAVNKVSKGVRDITLTFTATETIYNLPVITQKTVLSYKWVAGSGHKPKTYKRSVTNLNAAFAIAPKKNEKSVTVDKQGFLWATTTWNATPLYKSAGKAKIVKKQTTLAAGAKFSASLARG